MTKQELARLVESTLKAQHRYFDLPSGHEAKHAAFQASLVLEAKLRAACRGVLSEAEPDLFGSLTEDG